MTEQVLNFLDLRILNQLFFFVVGRSESLDIRVVLKVELFYRLQQFNNPDAMSDKQKVHDARLFHHVEEVSLLLILRLH